jgi:LysM repeat protein
MNKKFLNLIIIAVFVGVLAIAAYLLTRSRGAGDATTIQDGAAADVAQTVFVDNRPFIIEPEPGLIVRVLDQQAPPLVLDDLVEPTTPPVVDDSTETQPDQPTEAYPAPGEETVVAEPTKAPAAESTNGQQATTTALDHTNPDAAVNLQPHTVAAGDTLYSIAERYETSVSLMAEYGISQTSLVAGGIIDIPVANPAYCAAYSDTYIVKEGETALMVARRFNIDYTTLKLPNNLNDDYLVKAGQVLCIP